MASGERLVLPPEVVAILDRLRGFGIGIGEERIAEASPAWQRIVDALTRRAARRRAR
ncbi:hypothetical protein ACIGO9_05510 [Nocardia asteroides]|uniref:hypothetical protein n=1 Tax=Nocardia asteroides TaxID=1824 RepID=UPI0037C81BAD